MNKFIKTAWMGVYTLFSNNQLMSGSQIWSENDRTCMLFKRDFAILKPNATNTKLLKCEGNIKVRESRYIFEFGVNY